LHARHGRADTALAQCEQLEAMFESRPPYTPETVVRLMESRVAIARAYAETAQPGESHLPSALRALKLAASGADALRRDVDVMHIRLLRAGIMMRQGSKEAAAAMDEAVSLAEASGLMRLVKELRGGREPPSNTAEHPRHQEPVADLPGATRGAGILTAKEYEVLVLMSRALSNKEIGLAMGIGEQTIKWHVKNLFGKLNAASRKHAVARARMLGLIKL
jgi:LuxR family maltose regulon positive regulatory protein